METYSENNQENKPDTPNNKIRNNSMVKIPKDMTQKNRNAINSFNSNNSINSYSHRIAEDYKKIINYNNKNIFPQNSKSEQKIYSITQNSETSISEKEKEKYNENEILDYKQTNDKTTKNNVELKKKIHPPIQKSSYRDLRNNYKRNSISTLSKPINFNSHIDLKRDISKEVVSEEIKNIKIELNDISECIDASEQNMCKMRSISVPKIRKEKVPIPNSRKNSSNGLLKNLKEKNVSIENELKEMEEKYKEVLTTKENPNDKEKIKYKTLPTKNSKQSSNPFKNDKKNYHLNQYQIEEDSLILNTKEKSKKKEENKNRIENLENIQILYSIYHDNKNNKSQIAEDPNLQWYLILNNNTNNLLIKKHQDLIKSNINPDKWLSRDCVISINKIESDYENLKKNLKELNNLKNAEMVQSNLKITQLKNSLNELNLLNQSISEKLSRLNQEQEEKNSLIENIEAKFKGAEEKLKFYMNEYFEIEINFSKEKEEKKNFQEKIENLENALETVKEDYSKCKNDLEYSKNLNDYFKKLNDENKELLKELTAEIVKMKEENENSHLRLQTEQSKNSELKNEIKNLHAQIQNIPNVINNEIIKLKSKMKIESSEVLNLIQENKNLQNKNEELLKDLVKFNQSYNQLEQEKNLIEEEKKQNLIQIDILNTNIKTLNSKNEEMEKDKNILEMIINDLRCERERINFRISEIGRDEVEILKIEDFEITGKILIKSENFISYNNANQNVNEDEIKMPKTKYLDLQIQQQQSNIEFLPDKSLNKFKELLELEVERKSKEISTLTKKKEYLTSIVNSFDEKIQELQVVLNKLHEENKKLLAENSCLKKNLEHIREKNEFLQKENEEAKMLSNKEKNELVQQIQIFEKQFEEFISTNKILKQENDTKSKEIFILKEENKKLGEEELESRLVIQELEIRIEKLDEEIQILTNNNMKLKKENNKKTSESNLNLKTENEGLKEEIKKKEDFLKIQKEQIKKLEELLFKYNY